MNNRQEAILRFIISHKGVSISDLEQYIGTTAFSDISRITLIRDLNFLQGQSLIQRQGQGRTTFYDPILPTPLLEYFDVEKYFNIDPDHRTLKNKTFSFEVFKDLKKLFSPKELSTIGRWNEVFQKKISKASPKIRQKEFEKLTVEFCWKSSHIEGNTYSLLNTERLIKDNIEASGHSHEESTMILNHKRALDFIFSEPSYFKELTVFKILELHSLVSENLGISKGLRTSPVGIIGTIYKPLDNQHQINDAMQLLVTTLNSIKHPFERAFVAVLMLSYIQPFEDGNKRTSRILANAILLSENYCPLSYRSVDDVEYKKAIVLFYEQNSAEYFKRIFIEQFRNAIEK
jgi:Fic family protein